MNRGEGFRPRKRLGQHFLIQPGIVRKILDSAGFQSSDLVLEIGPGRGALTLPLAPLVGRLIAVEKDPRLVRFLEKRIEQERIANVELINEDILRFDFRQVAAGDSVKFKVTGNLPYNITSPVLGKLIENRHLVSKAVLMFQQEVGRRLTVSPGEKGCSAITLLIQYHARTRTLLKVPRTAFHPRPKVDSVVLELDFEHPHVNRAAHEPAFRKVVKAAFSHRRKTLINAMSSYLDSPGREALLKVIDSCGIDPARRAETLHMDEFICLADALSLTNPSFQ